MEGYVNMILKRSQQGRRSKRKVYLFGKTTNLLQSISKAKRLDVRWVD